MTNRRKHIPARLLPAAAVLALAICLSAGAYAANLGGIRRVVQIWIHGDQTNAVMEITGGSYTISYQGADGRTHEQAGGGIALDADGTERPLTEEELLEVLDSPDVSYEEDGTVWVYYHNQSIEITDKFVNGICRVKLVEGADTIYMTIKYRNGFSTSPDCYPDPREFN